LLEVKLKALESGCRTGLFVQLEGQRLEFLGFGFRDEALQVVGAEIEFEFEAFGRRWVKGKFRSS
jgi:hypothetical protein